MSRKNLELVREGLAAYNRGDLDAALALYHPDVEFVTLLLGNHHGKEAFLRLYEENKAAVLGYTLIPEEVIDAGDKVVAVVRMGGAGRVSEIGLGDRLAFLVTIKNGLIVRQQTFRNRAEALAAAGVSA